MSDFLKKLPGRLDRLHSLFLKRIIIFIISFTTIWIYIDDFFKYSHISIVRITDVDVNIVISCLSLAVTLLSCIVPFVLKEFILYKRVLFYRYDSRELISGVITKFVSTSNDFTIDYSKNNKNCIIETYLSVYNLSTSVIKADIIKTSLIAKFQGKILKVVEFTGDGDKKKDIKIGSGGNNFSVKFKALGKNEAQQYIVIHAGDSNTKPEVTGEIANGNIRDFSSSKTIWLANIYNKWGKHFLLYLPLYLLLKINNFDVKIFEIEIGKFPDRMIAICSIIALLFTSFLIVAYMSSKSSHFLFDIKNVMSRMKLRKQLYNFKNRFKKDE